jgi:tetratricopeptide (TPR) repeat protein
LDVLGEQADEVVRHYRRALQIKPSLVQAHTNLGLVLLRTGNSSDGLASLRKAVEIAPAFAPARYNLGNTLVIVGQPDEGLSHLRNAIANSPGFTLASEILAWFLATHPDSRVRDPNAAVETAEQARTMTRDRDAGVLDTLAAAYASGGQYRKAVEAAQKALGVASRLGVDELAGQIEDRLRLYENHTGYYEDPHLQLDRMIAKAKKREAANSNLKSGLLRPAGNDMIENPKSAEVEVQNGAEAISAK